MGTAIKHHVPERVKQSYINLTSGHSDANSLALDTHMAAVSVKELINIIF